MIKVGLLVGREQHFPSAFIDEVNRRDAGVLVEFVKLGGTQMNEPTPYAVIVDRVSHEVPYYRTYLKNAVLQGVQVINNPFMWTADDKFLGASLAAKLGVASPKTAVLPNKDYPMGIVHLESLRNLQYPMDWDALIDYVGLPCILKNAHENGRRDIYVCHSKEALWDAYNQSGQLTMLLQEQIEWDHYVYCLCLGQTEFLPLKYDPVAQEILVEHEHMDDALGQRVVDDARTLMQALGYDMNAIEFGIRDGVPYVIDLMNPVPDLDINTLTPFYFDWVVKHMADVVIRLAKKPQPQVTEMRWGELFS